jgi:hypothetical protein
MPRRSPPVPRQSLQNKAFQSDQDVRRLYRAFRAGLSEDQEPADRCFQGLRFMLTAHVLLYQKWSR